VKTIFYTATKNKRTDTEITNHIATVEQWTAGYTRGLPLYFGGTWYQLLSLECVADGVAFVVVIVASDKPQDRLDFLLPDWYRVHLETRVRILGVTL
jgi:hypothetical protein